MHSRDETEHDYWDRIRHRSANYVHHVTWLQQWLGGLGTGSRPSHGPTPSAIGGVRHVVDQPVQVGGDPGVHSGVVGLCTPGAEAGDAAETPLAAAVPGAHAQWSARVALEGGGVTGGRW